MNGAPESGRGMRIAAGGSVLAALLASACCWLPLLLLVFGVSALGVSAAFEKVRPLFLIVAALLLVVGFHLTYFRKEKCAPGSACDVPNRKLRRLNRIMLWTAAVMVALFAFFPNYVGILLGGGDAGASAAAGIDPAQEIHLAIDGMTCAACAVQIEKTLRAVPGVNAADVHYDDGSARVVVDAVSPPSRSQLAAAVEEAGYSLREP